MTREEAIKWLKHCAETDCDDCAYEIQPIEWCSEKMAYCVSVLEEALSEQSECESCKWYEPNHLICYPKSSAEPSLKAIKKQIDEHWYLDKSGEKGGDAEVNETKSPYMQQSPSDGADLISRADAIEAVAEEWLSEASAESPYVNDDDIGAYKKLAEELFAGIPSAKPKVVRVEYSPFTIEETSTPSQTSFRGTQEVKIIDIPSADRPQEDISEDGTLKVNVTDGAKVKRVLVWGDNNFGGLYYPDDRPQLLGKEADVYVIDESRPQGEWIWRTDIPIGDGRTSAGYICSNCGKDYWHGNVLNFCPNCGARMRGAE